MNIQPNPEKTISLDYINNLGNEFSLPKSNLFAILFSRVLANTTEKFPGSEQFTCNILWSMNDNYDGSVGGSAFILYSLILGFAVPLSLILVFYYLVIKKLQNVGPKNKSKDKKRSHRKVTRLVLTVITVYILSWSPYWVCRHKIDINRRLDSRWLFFPFSQGEPNGAN